MQSILDKITPGKWKIIYAKWGKDLPPEGFTIYTEEGSTEEKNREICGLNTSTSTRIWNNGYDDTLKPPKAYYLEPEEFRANVAALCAVPEMLAILERLATVDDNEDDLEMACQLIAFRKETKELLNSLNKDL